MRRSSDQGAGITRHRHGRGFVYRGPHGAPIDEPAAIERIRRLAVPPAWNDVWICPDPAGHLQATGRDRRGRKQYLYHPEFRSARDDEKYGRLGSFGRAMPKLRRRVKRDLGRRGLPRERVLAAAVRLLDLTALRVGGDAYAETNRTFGVTTLQRRHVHMKGARIDLVFRGKGAQLRSVRVDDRALARVVRRCRAAGPGRLLCYQDAQGSWHAIHAADVNAYVREHTNGVSTAKDFRTWGGTVAAVAALMEPAGHTAVPIGRVSRAVLAAAEHLGDTVAVSRRSYVHPRVLAAALRVDRDRLATSPVSGLRRPEAATLELLGPG